MTHREDERENEELENLLVAIEVVLNKVYKHFGISPILLEEIRDTKGLISHYRQKMRGNRD